MPSWRVISQPSSSLKSQTPYKTSGILRCSLANRNDDDDAIQTYFTLLQLKLTVLQFPVKHHQSRKQHQVSLSNGENADAHTSSDRGSRDCIDARLLRCALRRYCGEIRIPRRFYLWLRSLRLSPRQTRLWLANVRMFLFLFFYFTVFIFFQN